MSSPRADLVASELVAVVVAVGPHGPAVLTVGAPGGVPRLPSGPLRAEHRSLQTSLRAWVEAQTGVELGYVEQLYTFADRERVGSHHHLLSVSYLGLTRIGATSHSGYAWRPWSEFLPWEDRRDPDARALADDLGRRLRHWAAAGASSAVRADRQARVDAAFSGVSELALQRYQLLHEAGLTAESGGEGVGARMLHDHRRILATGVSRLRAKIQYRPVVFELVPPQFTLGQLQTCVEHIAGTELHTQNFRRLVQAQQLVEATGATESGTGGRPAKLYRFRREVELERYAAGTKLPLSRGD
ncbi:MAG: hypothetical protein Q4G43_17115 [Mobilicoccus sp.]|nr:hypothetical protein [Mobilicoccus sp.]